MQLNVKQRRMVERARCKAGLSQRQLADIAGIASKTVGRIERGQGVHPANIVATVTALRLDMDAFYGTAPVTVPQQLSQEAAS